VVTGTTRSYAAAYDDVSRVIEAKPECRVFGLTMLLSRGKTVFIADTTVHELPSAEELADIAVQTAGKARQMGQDPRVALLSFSNFGNPRRERAQRVRDAVALLDQRHVDFEYDGEMGADVALNHALMRELYPFCRLSGPANILIMPALHTANVAAKLLTQLGGGTVIGPLLIGLTKPVQIVELGATVSDLVNMAALAAHDAIG
jgi:malate dehydrogenase (oxaloacetate-decarboxylating)(NADP+)